MAKITVHSIVKNEDKWIWYALMSVKDIVDEILIFDTGSTDNTCKIVQSIKDKKIVFEEKGEVDSKKLVSLRQEQLERTKTDWILLVDGDEIWPNKTLSELKKIIETAPSDKWGIVLRAWNLLTDVYHYHPESETYQWPYAPKTYLGWANLRAVRHDIPGLHLKGNYPLEAYCDRVGTPIQNYGEKRLLFLNERYFHMTYLPRSSSQNFVLNRKGLKRLELGKPFSKNFSFPEVFKREHPSFVPTPWSRRPLSTFLIASLTTPIKKIKRRLG